MNFINSLLDAVLTLDVPEESLSDAIAYLISDCNSEEVDMD